MDILARFSHDHLDHTQDSKVHLVVSLKAPTFDWMEKRPQLCVVVSVDLSGSMKGDKLLYAKQSIDKLVDQLQPGDYCGIVGFETRAHVLVKPQLVTAEFKQLLKAETRKLTVMGGTNFSEGMLQAAREVEMLDLPPTVLKRIIMFTDGQPTTGVVDTKMILKMISAGGPFEHVTISAFGYGDLRGGCDQQFLTDFAAAARGNYAYVQNPDDALSAFGKELGGLLSTYSTNLDLEIEPVNGHCILKTLTNIPVDRDVMGIHEISLPDILAEETRHFVFEVQISKQPKALPREFTAFNIRLAYDVLTENGTKERKNVEQKARVTFVKPADAQKAPHKEVDDVVALHKVLRAQLEAEEEAKKGNFEAASAWMQSAGEEAKTGGRLHLANAAFGASKRLVSKSQYTSGQGYLRSLVAGGTRGYGASSMDKEAQAALTSMNVSLSNGAMNQVSDQFTSATPNGAEGNSVMGQLFRPATTPLPVTPDLSITSDSTNKSG